jgi:hypothetical protein
MRRVVFELVLTQNDFKKILSGHRAVGVVAQDRFKRGLLDCFITEVAQQ